MTATILKYKFKELTKPFLWKKEDFCINPEFKEVKEFKGEDQRHESRRRASNRMLVQIVECEDSQKKGHTLSAKAQNLSSQGIQFDSELAIPAGSKVDIWVQNESSAGSYFLCGLIIWSQADEDRVGQYKAGVKLLARDWTDIKAWRLGCKLLD